MGVEIALHQLAGVAFEISPIVFVGEADRRDSGPRRERPQFVQLICRQRPVNGQKLVVLVFAHGFSAMQLLQKVWAFPL